MLILFKWILKHSSDLYYCLPPFWKNEEKFILLKIIVSKQNYSFQLSPETIFKALTTYSAVIPPARARGRLRDSVKRTQMLSEANFFKEMELIALTAWAVT